MLCSLRTLENKISDAGPTNQRIDPHILTIAKKLLMDEGAIKTYPAEPKKNEIQWYYLNGTSEEDLIKRYQELEPIHRATVDPHFTKRMGQTMEIAVSRALQGRSDLYSTGHYSDLNDHPDDKAYSKDEPPSLVGNLAIPGKKKLDFEIFTETAGVIGIEVKNIREWIYVNRAEVTEMLGKCCALNAVPVLIARRIAYETFSVLNACGVLIHQTYNQMYPKHDEGLGEPSVRFWYAKPRPIRKLQIAKRYQRICTKSRRQNLAISPVSIRRPFDSQCRTSGDSVAESGQMNSATMTEAITVDSAPYRTVRESNLSLALISSGLLLKI